MFSQNGRQEFAHGRGVPLVKLTFQLMGEGSGQEGKWWP